MDEVIKTNQTDKDIFQIQRNIGLAHYRDWSKVDKRTVVNFDCKAKLLPDYAKTIPENGVIVEIGSRHGASMAIFGLTSKESVRVYCVELNVIADLPKNIKKYGLSGKASILPGDSAEVAKRWKLPIDFLFIDGGHSYENEMSDSEKWAPFVKKGGIVAWHDYDYPLFDGPNVKKVVEDFMRAHREFKEIHTEPYIFIAQKI